MEGTRNNRCTNPEERCEKKQAIIAALTRATGEIGPLTDEADNADDDNEYYTLTQEEMEALINGDIGGIESWVSNLDRRHANWLLRWLIRENW